MQNPMVTLLGNLITVHNTLFKLARNSGLNILLHNFCRSIFSKLMEKTLFLTKKLK